MFSRTYFLFSGVIFFLGLYLFHLQATLQIASDLTLHLNFINPIVAGKLKLPHPGFEYSIYFLAKLLQNNYFTASTIFLAFILLSIASIKYFFLQHFANISAKHALLFAIGLMLISAICVPMFNHNLYLGQGSPNVWHNPTLLCIKPLAFLCVYFVISALETLTPKIWLLVGSLLLISFIYKPSFGIVFIPAVSLYILWQYTNNLRSYIYFFLMILPSLLFATLFQLQHWFLLKGNENEIIFYPFGVLHLYTSNVFISFLLATAFPLLFLMIHPKRVLANRYLCLSWLMLVIGYLQYALLAETQCFTCANFSWGFLIALDLVFVFTFIDFILYIKGKIHLPLFKTWRSLDGFLALVFLVHFTCGIAYLGRYVLTGSYL